MLRLLVLSIAPELKKLDRVFTSTVVRCAGLVCYAGARALQKTVCSVQFSEGCEKGQQVSLPFFLILRLGLG